MKLHINKNKDPFTFILGDKIRYIKRWDAIESGYSGSRPDIALGTVLEVIAHEGALALRAPDGFVHTGWMFTVGWHQKVTEVPLTQEELDRSIPLPSIDDLGRFVDGMKP